MTFTKAFPKKSDKSVYPQWEEVSLTAEEETVVEATCRAENKKIMQECLIDAEEILKEKGLKGYETSLAAIATALFEKRASHVVYAKEEKAKEKFDVIHQNS